MTCIKLSPLKLESSHLFLDNADETHVENNDELTSVHAVAQVKMPANITLAQEDLISLFIRIFWRASFSLPQANVKPHRKLLETSMS